MVDTTHEDGSKKQCQYLCWLDLEMSGLDPQNDSILEAAAVVTDLQLKVIAKTGSIVLHCMRKRLDTMDDWNRDHHGKSGLTAACAASQLSLAQAQKQLLDFFGQYCAPQTSPLCGSSVWQDRLFLRRQMPELEKFFHYRIIDVSTVKQLVRAWYPLATEKPFVKKHAHRAPDDILESIAELTHYRSLFFIV